MLQKPSFYSINIYSYRSRWLQTKKKIVHRFSVEAGKSNGKEYLMNAVIIFTGTGPLLILTTFSSLEDTKFLEKLHSKGITKFIAYDLPVDLVKKTYGAHFKAIMNDVKQTDDLRVLDYNGHNVFYNFSFRDMGSPIFHES